VFIWADAIMNTPSQKIALVTGASRGIGRATALALAGEGARVLVHYGNSAPEARSVVDEIRAGGGNAEALQADLGTSDGPLQLARQVRAVIGERLDMLVLNAGIAKAAAFEDHSIEDFDKLFATNVRSPFFLFQQLLPLFGEGSSVILVSSLGARFVPGAGWRSFAPGLRGDKRSAGYFGEALGVCLGATGNSRQCGGAGRDRNGYVAFHQNRRGTTIDPRHAGAETHRTSR